MKEHVVKTVSLMTPMIIGYVTKNCWFLASLDDAWAFTFTGNDLRGKHLIFLSDDLLHQHESQIRYSIAHEIGHVILGHRNSVFIKQSRQEITKQEKEADEFAKQFTEKTSSGPKGS
jgi:Zn-dependent protease with chaperone function